MATLLLGFRQELFSVEVIDSKWAPVLPFTLFIFPSLLEEAFFRGLLIPRALDEKSILKKAGILMASTLAFVVWHPLNALTINQSAQGFFLDPTFLLITSLLGLTCGYTYMKSKSLWVPVVIHWLTVLVWVFLLGGRNMVLD